MITILVMVLHFSLFVIYVQMNKSGFRSQTFIQSNTITKFRCASEDLYKNKNNLVWKDDNKELEVNGVLHEVVYIQMIKSTAVIYVMNDENENSLITKFHKTLGNHHNNLAKLFHLLFQLNFFTNFSGFDFSLEELYVKIRVNDFLFSIFPFNSDLIKPPGAL